MASKSQGILKKATDNKVIKKLKSIAVSTYILTMFFWTILTICMILMALIVVDLDVTKVSQMWYISIVEAFIGSAILVIIFSTVKDIRMSRPILYTYLVLIVIFLLMACIRLTGFTGNEILIAIFIILAYIMNFFPAYFLAKEIVGNYKSFREIFTKKITKIMYEEKEIITATYEENKNSVTKKEVTTEESPMGIIIFSIIMPIVLATIKLLV